MAYRDDEISGVGGWLLVFIALLALAMPLGTAWWLTAGLTATEEVLEFESYGWVGGLATYRIVATVMGVIHILICWIVAVRLVRNRKWRTIRESIVALLLVGPGFVLLDTVAILILLQKSLDRITFFNISNAIAAIIVPGLSIWYLSMSRRVANTYPRPTETAHLTTIFD